MTLSFVTTNKHKFIEAQAILAPYGVELKHVDHEYPEDHETTLEDIAAHGAELVAQELQEPVLTEDTGLFFAAFESFPGVLPKYIFQQLGFDGIFRLLADKPRGAVFRTVVAYAVPGEKTELFIGEMLGVITEKVFDLDKDVMPYDHIFIPDGSDVTISGMSLAQKNELSQRGKAFRALGEYIQKNSRGS